MDAVFRALGNRHRRRLMDLLYARDGQTLTELNEHLDMSRQAVSKHLDVLEEANLVVPIWQGREKLHYLNPKPVHEIRRRWLAKFEEHRLDALRDLKRRLEEDADGDEGE